MGKALMRDRGSVRVPGSLIFWGVPPPATHPVVPMVFSKMRGWPSVVNQTEDFVMPCLKGVSA